jgi:deazaflavin-dependent oxidoreductase (nitroreductase family)
MPLPKALARANRVGLNRITRPFAIWVPGLGVVIHVGRHSGRTYRTPVNVFRTGQQCTFALTYGTQTDWVRNVVAAGGCALISRRRRIQLTSPRFVHDESRASVGLFARPVLRLLRVADFLVLDVAPGEGAGGNG